MLAKDVMTPGVVSISPEASIKDAAALMLERHISGLPVIDEAGALVGMVTEGDLLKRVELGTQQKRPKWLEFILGPGRMSTDYVQTRGRKVGEVMTSRVVTVNEDADLADVVTSMNDHRIKRIPVLRGGSVIGLVTRADLLKALEGMLERGAVAANPSDLEIRSAILAELEAQSWAPTGTINISVQGGVVELNGCIFDDREREALQVAAENVAGVKAVKDHVTTIEPYSGTVISQGDAA
ncbi:histidine kinase [Alsobacter soli]|uniref:Histidine kinase n=1 Tax=Alsobacter soli TaxID=2109933 RepID=A0A2T1HXV5_9HYPH|nr:CBS domain-containing protein [Alsobacter soli]PSC06445.1 histidine kinase [Alsobacter soli]